MARSDFGFQIGSALATNYLTDSKFVRAGYIAVNTIAERDALPIDTGNGGVIVSGSLCYVTVENKYYKYSGTEWEEAQFGGGEYTAGDGIEITNKVISNTIYPLVPGQATAQNQLADKAFVNSTVQTATANFRGSWTNWAAVPTDPSLYPVDYTGSHIPTNNDYLVIQDASDYPVGEGETALTGTWRFKYIGIWETVGKNGWNKEYKINDEPFTAAQIAALNSGITSGKVSTYDAYAAQIAAKSTVSVSASGTATDEVQYITVDGVEKKLAGGGDEPDNKSITRNLLEQLQAVGLINQKDLTTNVKEWVGSLLEYKALATKDANTIYFTYDDLVDLIIEVTGYPLTVAHGIVADAIDWKMYGNSIQGSNRLPAEYTELEYIESTGQTQYIDTGIYSKNITSAEVKFNLSNNNNYTGFGDTSTGTGSGYPASMWCETSSIKWYYQGGTVTLGQKNTDITATLPFPTQTAGSTVHIFHANGASISNCVTGKYYYVRLLNGTNIVFNGIPAKNSDEVVGLYDLVNGQFYDNDGTGAFTAGPSLTPSPTNPIEVKSCGGGGSILPSGYQELEYIEEVGTNTSAKTVYKIDTGIAGSLDTEFETDIKHISTDPNIFTVCASNATSTGGIILSHYSSGPAWATKFGDIQFKNCGNIPLNEWNTVIMNKNNLLVNGVSKGTIGASSLTDTSNLYIMCDVWTSPIPPSTKLQMKNFIIRKSGVVVFNGIACKRTSDNECGFYDTISNTFKGNSGTGTFTAGPDAPSRVTLPIKLNGTTQVTLTPDSPIRKVGTYADYIDYGNQKIYTNVGVKVLDGTENWTLYQTTAYISGATASWGVAVEGKDNIFVTHFPTSNQGANIPWSAFDSDYNIRYCTNIPGVTDLTTFKSWLAAQYAAGTPVTIYYPLATTTEETFVVPALTLVDGQNTFTVDTEITPSNMYIKCKASEVN